MLRTFLLFSCVIAFGGARALLDDKPIVTFSPGAKTTYEWNEVNDPVMGGRSTGSFSVQGNGTTSMGVFQGTCRIVPSLKAPGFCQATTKGFALINVGAYVNGGVALTVRTTTPTYTGFKFGMSAIGASHHHGGHEIGGSYKANFTVPSGTGWQTVKIPFAKMSSDWSDFTGNCFTKDPDGYQHRCCSPENKDVCPNAKSLSLVDGFTIWSEGVAGDFLLQVESVVAYDA